MNIEDITGLDLQTIEQAEKFYAENKPDDAPEFSEEVLPYLRHLG